MEEEEDPLGFISRQSQCSAMVEELLKRLPYARQQDGVPPAVKRVQEPPNGPPSRSTGTEVGDVAEEDAAARRRLLPLWARVNPQKANQAQTQPKRGDDINTILSVLRDLAREARSQPQLGALDDDDADADADATTTGDFLETAIRRGLTFTKSPT